MNRYKPFCGAFSFQISMEKVGFPACSGFGNRDIKILFTNSVKTNRPVPLFERFSMNFRYFFRLQAIAERRITLLVCAIPMVFILRMPMNRVKVPNTGSTVLCRLHFMYLPCGLFTLSLLRSYSSRQQVTENCFSFAIFY